MANAAPAPQRNFQAENAQARAIIANNAYEYTRQIYRKVHTDAVGAQISIPVKNTGLLCRFVVQVDAAISGGSGDVQTLQELGAGNFFSRVQFFDFSNKERINTTGWHLQAIASAKRGRPFGSAFTSDTSLGYGNNYTAIQKAPATINAASSGTHNFFMAMEIPVCRSELDWRGIIDANVTNASARIELTVNPNMFKATAVTDAVRALYKSGSSTVGTLDTYTITVYQIGFDQVPVQANGRSLIPILDASVAYMLNNTEETGLAANSEFEVSFANNRTFLSLFSLLDNGGTLYAGTDISFMALQSANWTRFKENNPKLSALLAREKFAADLPKGMYYHDFLKHPINSRQAGNVTFNILPTTINANPVLMLGWESLADLVTVQNGATIGA